MINLGVEIYRKEEFTSKYGEMREVIVDRIESIVTEIKYVDKDDKILGYWAYGHFEPGLPYQGQF